MLEGPRSQPRAPEPAPPASPTRRWDARLDVGLGLRAGRTRIGRLVHEGPLRIQRAFHPESDGTAHVVVIHPPGGCVGGDQLRIEARVQESASALLTTPGAGKVYRTNGHGVSVVTVLHVGPRAVLEYVPQEMVVYEDADARLLTRVVLEAEAQFLGWEVVCLGRPAAGEGFDEGSLRLDFSVHAGGAPIFVERGQVAGGSELAHASWGLQGYAAFGTMVATVDALVEARAALAEHGKRDVAAAATELSTAQGPLLVVRALGPDGTRVRGVLEAVRHRVRDRWGRPRIDPAIWRS